MHLDDVESTSALRVEQYLSKIKVMRKIAHKLIDFMAQLEDFQKTIWLKKKFVVETSYCIALGHIDERFYPEITANEVQRKEWVDVCSVDQISGDLGSPAYTVPLSLEFLRSLPGLMVDTRHYSPDFTARLIETFPHLEKATDGVLIYGENYQALSLLQHRLLATLQCIYIDPPYNTDASAIVYKNNYKASSWMCLIENRVNASVNLLRDSGVLTMAIDDQQVSEARLILAPLFAKELGLAVVRSNPQSRKSKETLSPTHEYALFYGRSSKSFPGSLELTDKRLARYPKRDDRGHYSWMNFIRTGTNDRREDRPKLFYPIFVDASGTLRIPHMKWSPRTGEYGEYILIEEPTSTETAVYPVVQVNGGRIEKNWHRGHERVAAEPSEYRIRREDNGTIKIDFKTRIDEHSTPVTWWDKPEYASANYGAAELKSLFGSKPFNFPKAIALVADCIRTSNVASGDTVLDYFAGSGTTAHAVMQLNREDGGRRKFILVEMGEYFASVILPRVKKVAYTPEWKDGKPARAATKKETDRGPRLVKVLRLESYEDALNNLDTRRTNVQAELFDAPETGGEDRLKEEYMLRYMLDVETRGSQSLLNVSAFSNPTAYRLKVKIPGSDESREVNVDLMETFNYLIGMTVRYIAVPQSFQAAFKRDDEGRLRLDARLKQNKTGPWWFRTVEGITPDGRKALVIWRKLTGDAEQDNLVLDEWFTRQGYSTKDYEFDLIFVNGDNNLENLRQPDETWKVRLIEENFHRLMFDVESV